eukprot:CAMPEP_0113650274 /NCGR_PEP_ID=MMETSP0017_2-20120614/26747_1 /TAXON_ID=2856 /ORGANISM="Cylindrotheca closterium" /LENGTH=1366 /DNA_ID=CAMNT_0000562767 /DNA_START=208 /DNA_END=4305 /DNA_ORIENTATION=+ /assembly_acc=CAM_ASM_000147
MVVDDRTTSGHSNFPGESTELVSPNDSEPNLPVEVVSETMVSPKTTCFVSASYTKKLKGLESMDNMIHVNYTSPFTSPYFKFFMFTNWNDDQWKTPGWTKITTKYNYTRPANNARYGKFLGWKYDQIREGCDAVFFLDLNVQLEANQSAWMEMSETISLTEPGLMQFELQQNRSGIMDELAVIKKQRKDYGRNIQSSIDWFNAQPDFENDIPIYMNQVFGYNPKSPTYQKLSQEFWDQYSKEGYSSRDQPLWAFMVHRYHVTPLAFPATSREKVWTIAKPPPPKKVTIEFTKEVPSQYSGPTPPKTSCFLTASYSNSVKSMDHMININNTSPHFKFFLFTNWNDDQWETPGWTKITTKHNYTRSITHSRYGKFMGWKYDQIREGCDAVYYMDANIMLHAKQSTWMEMAATISSTEPGLMQFKHNQGRNGISDEFRMIQRKRKDYPENVQRSLTWVRAQPDFEDHIPIYMNQVFGYNPKSPTYQKLSQGFWDHYSKEGYSSRDQPLWAFMVHRYHVAPLAFPAPSREKVWTIAKPPPPRKVTSYANQFVPALFPELSNQQLLGRAEEKQSPKKSNQTLAGNKHDANSNNIMPRNNAGSCHFERGRGHFNLTKLAAQGDWTWKPENCEHQYLDYIDLLSQEKRSESQAQRQSDSVQPKRKRPLNLISIGDSLSRHQVQRLCAELKYGMLPQLYDDPKSTVPKNKANGRKNSVNVCQNDQKKEGDKSDNMPPSLTISYFSIFGMKRPCWNGGFGQNADSREYNTTVDRVNDLLRPEVLDRIPKDGHNVFWIHSALWDVSTGCNDAPTIGPSFAQEYRQGIHDILDALRKIDPTASIYWRTSPPISRKKNGTSVQKKRGRSRANQAALNQVLKETAPQGTVIDWWQQVEEVMNQADPILGSKFIPDGTHYTKPPSLSAYNLFLNTLFEREPGLWSGGDRPPTDGDKNVAAVAAVRTEGDDWISMNTNAYTFLYTSALCSGPFLIAGVVTSLIQYTVFSLFLLDLLNTTSIPPGVTALVRACQAIAIIIAFLVETDMLRALRAVFYSEGFDEMANAFHGFAPWKFSSLGGWDLSAMQELHLHNNVLFGTIPSEVGYLSALTNLRLYNSAISGNLPSEVGNLSALTSLYLYNNTLSGTIPSEVGRLSALGGLTLSANALTGTIPSEVGNLSALSLLYLHSNALSGTLPSEIGNLSALNELIIRDNALSGRLPSEIGLLDHLLYLNLRDNVLNETLPTEIGRLTTLQHLILGGNKLSGPLPTEILQLTNLRELELSGNLFTEAEVNNTMLSLGLIFSCDETTVEMVLTTDYWPTETTWAIATEDGTVVASGGGYVLEAYAHDEKMCMPSDACNFTLFDQYQDGGPTVEITRLG